MSDANGESSRHGPLKEIAKFLTCLGIAVAFAFALHSDRDPEPTSPSPASSPAFGSDDYCAERAPKMREESPSLYYTNQEAYDACREAGEAVKELRGDIKRRK